MLFLWRDYVSHDLFFTRLSFPNHDMVLSDSWLLLQVASISPSSFENRGFLLDHLSSLEIPNFRLSPSH